MIRESNKNIVQCAVFFPNLNAKSIDHDRVTGLDFVATAEYPDPPKISPSPKTRRNIAPLQTPPNF